MTRSTQTSGRRDGAPRPTRHAAMAVVALAGVAVAALAALAVARSFTISVSKNVSVGSKHEAVASDSKGKTLYTLSGESARPRHLFCTDSGCLGAWPMLTTRSAKGLSKAPGIKGRLGVLKRGKTLQVTLGGHPLYRFSGDGRHQAMGEGLMIGSHTWHAVKASVSSNTTNTTTTTTTTSTTMTTTTSTCRYPPYYC